MPKKRGGKRSASKVAEQAAQIIVDSEEDNNTAALDPKLAAYITMTEDNIMISKLADTPTPENFQRVVARATRIWEKVTQSSPHPQLVSNFLSWAGRQSPDNLPLRFNSVLAARRAAINRFSSQKRRLIKLSNLNPGTVDKEAFLNRIPLKKCARLATAFPPPLLYISESQEVYDHNMSFVLEHELPDTRIPRKFIFELNNPESWDLPAGTTGLQHDLGPNESAHFEDEDGNLVAIVIRNACADQRVVDFVDHTVGRTVSTRRNARKEDRGHISQMGLSAGSRSKPKLGWVRNIEHKKKNTALHQEINYDASSCFAVLWSLARSLLPPVIIDDFNRFIESLGPDLRMDGDGKMGSDAEGRGVYHIKVGDDDFVFHGAELAPPCGVMAENYCRYTHFENQPHTWAVSLTTSRSYDSAVSAADAGGHFYISSYGIRVQSAPNTMIAWRPKDWHGTSLFLINPNACSPEKQYHQRGLCIVTGTRVVNAVKKWRAGGERDALLDELEEAGSVEHPSLGESGSNELDKFVADLKEAPLRRSERLAGKPKKSFAAY